MPRVLFREERCKGCGLCIEFCPRKLIVSDTGRINASGFHPVKILDQEKCTGCTSCAIVCPDVVIEIER